MMLPTIRPEVETAVRKAVMLTYVYSAHQMTLEELAETLNEPAISTQVLAGWAQADNWDDRRAQQKNVPEVAHQRMDGCMQSVRRLHNRALRMQSSLRPKSWEAAAMVQMRCAETLRAWSAEEAQAALAAQSPEDSTQSDIPTTAWASVSDENWQAMAHSALAGFKKPKNEEDAVMEETEVKH